MQISKAKALFYIIAVFLIAITVLPLVRADAWWIRIFDFPRIHIAVLGVLTILLFLHFSNAHNGVTELLLLAFLLCSVAYQFFTIYPYTPLSPRQVMQSADPRPETKLSLFISNVLMSNRQSGKYLEMIRNTDPDLVLVNEPDGWWEAQLRELEAKYPYVVKYPLDNTYGMILYSKLRLIDPQVMFLVEPAIPSIHTLVALRSGDIAELHCVHPRPPSPMEAKDAVERDAELLIVAKRARSVSKPVIVAGDLNDVAWSHTTRLFQKISGLLDPPLPECRREQEVKYRISAADKKSLERCARPNPCHQKSILNLKKICCSRPLAPTQKLLIAHTLFINQELSHA